MGIPAFHHDSAETQAEIHNVACGELTTLNELFRLIRDGVAAQRADVAGAEPEQVSSLLCFTGAQACT